MRENGSYDEFDAALAEEAVRVSARARALLDGPDGTGQFEDTSEEQRVVITLPKGLVHLAAFLAVMSRAEAPAREDKKAALHFWQYVNGRGHDDPGPQRNLSRMRRAYLEEVLFNHLQFSLHLLATGKLDLTGEPSEQAGPGGVTILMHPAFPINQTA